MPILSLKPEDPGVHYICMICNTPISNIYNLKKVSYYSYKYGYCYVFDHLINIITPYTHELLHISNKIIEHGIGDIKCKDIHCTCCNNLLGWKIQNDKYLIIKSKVY